MIYLVSSVIGVSTRELILCVVIMASSTPLFLETLVVLLGEQWETLFNMMVSNSITKVYGTMTSMKNKFVIIIS